MIIKDRKLNEGMHLVAYVRIPGESGIKTIEDSDYNSKKDFTDDLKANGYTVISVNDNRDLYLTDNTNYTKLSQLKTDLKWAKKMYDDAKKNNRATIDLYKRDYEKLRTLYDDVMKQPLYESSNQGSYIDITLYHGSSNKNLTNLDIGKSEGSGDQLGKGIYLTTDYEEAQGYAGPQGKVYKVKLNNNLKLFNLNDKLSEPIKTQLIKELDMSNNKNIRNRICIFNRKTYEVKDKQKGLQFYHQKQKEWEQLDNKYFGNRPKVVKNKNGLQVIYTDYNDVKEAIDKMTGKNLVSTLTIDIDPEVFVSIIISSGYDGVITHNGKWYVIYKNIGGVSILNESKSTLKTIDTNKLPDLQYELESRSENSEYNKLYNKVKKSKTGKIRCTYNELDLISSIYDNDNYDYDKLNIQKILYESVDNDFQYLDDEDIPKYNDYIGLSMQIDGTKTKIKVLKSKINNTKYDSDRNKYLYKLEYYKKLLSKYLEAIKSIKDLKESTSIKNKYKHMVKDFYRTPTGTWMIDLNDGYTTSYGTNYIEAKTKSQCIYELENEVSAGEPGKSLFESNISSFNKHKLEEVSRNEMLATSKAQTYTRYLKSSGYKGFTIYDIDTTSVLTTDSLRVTCKVGDYWDTVELENILYWIQLYAEQQPNNQVNSKVVTKALMDAIDAMDIKVNCTCPDIQYRFAYKLTKMDAKYGKPETRPAKIRNPNDYGYLCKHLIAMLSNKKWIQQVSGTLMDYVEKRIVEINRYLKVKPGEELTLPNELARQNAKKGYYTKLFKNTDNTDDNNTESDTKQSDNNQDNEQN